MTNENGIRQFGPFQMLGPHGPLKRRNQELPLRPKAAGVLWTLLSRPGQIVPRRILFEQVWPRVIVSDDALAAQVTSLRQTLGDDPDAPQYIATVRGVGYRFVANVRNMSAPASPSADTQRREAGLLVGRESELAQLQSLYEAAVLGRRTTVFVTGEAGLGKTTLLDCFTMRNRIPAPLYGYGQCVEQSGPGEAFLPVLEALGSLCRDPEGDRVIDILRRLAPISLSHLGLPLSDEDRRALQEQTAGAKPERILRELADAIDAICAEQPLVLTLEDLHWSDISTVELVAMLARRRDPARLLVLCTYRPADVIIAEHPIKRVKQNLIARKQGAELALNYLNAANVAAYLKLRFPSAALHERVVNFVHGRSEGLPLFMVHLADDLAQRTNNLSKAQSVLEVLTDLDQSMSRGLMDLIDAQLMHMPVADQRVLEAASIVGTQFAAADVAAALGTSAAAAENDCERLARHGQFIEDRGLYISPDGKRSGQYGFRHGLYAQALISRLASARFATLHRLVAEHKEAAYGSRAQEIAAELAMHFESAAILDKAVRYRILAAHRAQARIAPEEARLHAEKGLECIQRLPSGASRDQHEFTLLLIVVYALTLAEGYGSKVVQSALNRIQLLLPSVADPALRAHALTFLWLSHHIRSNFDQAIGFAQKMVEVGERAGNLDTQCMGLSFQSVSLQRRGAHRAAEILSNKALSLARPPDSGTWIARTSTTPVVSALLSQALTRWMLGYADQSIERACEAVTLEERSGNPYSLCGTISIGYIMALVCRRDPDMLLNACNEAIVLCERHQHTEGFVFANKYRGLALCMLGQIEDGLALHREVVEKQRRAGLSHTLTLDYGHEAEYCIIAGDLKQARVAMDQAFAAIHGRDDRSWEPELWRVEAELVLAERPAATEEIEDCFCRAIQIAREQEARSLELRSATALARHWLTQKRRADAENLLRPVYEWFTEGFETPDLKSARAVLDGCSKRPRRTRSLNA